jgi:hypothetical protein
VFSTRFLFSERNANGDPDSVDSVTEHWPISPDLRPSLDEIKYDYRALPLRVYIGDKYVSVEKVNDTLRGALVEIHFEVRHFTIQQKNFDSFNASIKQIIVLQPGEPEEASPYKRDSVLEGSEPIRKKPTLDSRKHDEGMFALAAANADSQQSSGKETDDGVGLKSDDEQVS